MERDVWSRTIVGWHVAFALMMGLAALSVLISGEVAPSRRLPALGLLAVLCVAYWLIVMRGPGGAHQAHEGYLAIAIVVTGLLCAIEPSLSLVLFIVYAQVWPFTRDLRTGVGFTVALTAVVGAGFVAYYRGEATTAQIVREVGPQMAVSMLFSVLLGIWIYRIVDQSRERAELIAELQATRSELAAANHAQGVMAERERMAREIHDTLAQGFTSIVMLAQVAAVEAQRDPAASARRIAAIEDVARENLAEARALVAAFSPLELESSTLQDAVQRLAERFTRQTGLVVDVDLPESLTGLTRDQEVVLLRATQEALTNVRRHADARRVRIRLVAGPSEACMEIVDDGVGFDGTNAGTSQPTGGFGLAGMRGRVSDVGGRVDVSSRPGAGTHIVVHVPTASVPVQAEGERA